MALTTLSPGKEAEKVSEFVNSRSMFMLLSSAEALGKEKLGKKQGKRTRKKYEKRRKPLPDTTPKTRVIRGSTFSNFNLHAYDHFDQNHLTPCS